MKIVFLSQYFFPEQFSNNAIAKWLVSRGHQVDVVCCVPNYPSGTFADGYSNTQRRDEEWEGVQIYRTWTKARGTRAVSLILNYLTYPITASWTLFRQIKGTADVSFVSMPSPLLQALPGVFLQKIYRVPTVYWVQDICPESAVLSLNLRASFIVKPLSWLCGWLYRRADLILVQSAAFPPMIERFGVDPTKIRVLPNTAPDTYRPIKAGGAGDIAKIVESTLDGDFHILFAGNIGESQDFDTYIETAALLKAQGHQVRWIIIGSGRDMGRVQAEVAKRDLEDCFRFLGRFKEEEMPNFFAYADGLLVGLKDNEIFRLTVPYKVQCYMACGKPIIGSLNGEGARIISDANAGVCADASRPDMLMKNILQMMALSKEDRAVMGAAGRTFFEQNYAKEKVYHDLERWLTEVKDTAQR
jgi:glycosyltransferase involved in cell wall biosynthesis